MVVSLQDTGCLVGGNQLGGTSSSRLVFVSNSNLYIFHRDLGGHFHFNLSTRGANKSSISFLWRHIDSQFVETLGWFSIQKIQFKQRFVSSSSSELFLAEHNGIIAKMSGTVSSHCQISQATPHQVCYLDLHRWLNFSDCNWTGK